MWVLNKADTPKVPAASPLLSPVIMYPSVNLKFERKPAEALTCLLRWEAPPVRRLVVQERRGKYLMQGEKYGIALAQDESFGRRGEPLHPITLS